jgi:hypothetical protein
MLYVAFIMIFYFALFAQICIVRTERRSNDNPTLYFIFFQHIVFFLSGCSPDSNYDCDFRLYIPDAANNEILAGDPFDNSGSDIFTLTGGSPTAGMVLSAPYDKDMFGNTRGSDGLWDRGALEY